MTHRVSQTTGLCFVMPDGGPAHERNYDEAATENDKLADLIQHLTEWHLDIFGGYPYDYIWIGDTLVVAELDDAKDRARTSISTHSRDGLVAWWDRAHAMALEDQANPNPDFGDLDLDDYYNETAEE